MVADMSEPEGSRWQQFTGNSGHGQPQLRRPPGALARRTDAGLGRRGAVVRAAARARRPGLVSRRGEITLSPDEQAGLLETALARRGLDDRAAWLAALDADVVHAARGEASRCLTARPRALGLDLRRGKIPEGAQRRARPAGDAAGRNRRGVRRAPRRPDRGRGRGDSGTPTGSSPSAGS